MLYKVYTKPCQFVLWTVMAHGKMVPGMKITWSYSPWRSDNPWPDFINDNKLCSYKIQ